MILRHVALYSLVALLAVPSSALAQDDDLLTPLTPQTKPSRSKAGKTRVVKKKKKAEKKAVVKKPSRSKSSTAKATRGKGKKAVQPAPEEDLLAPLTPQKTELAVRVTGGVKGARLLVDGKDVGPLTAAPVPVELTPGEHSVVVRRAGYADYSRRVDVKAGEQTELAVSLEPTMGFATLTADVRGAVVAVDGLELGVVPQANVLLKPGSREIEFRAPGFKPDVRNITVIAGRSYDVVGELRPLEDPALASNVDAPKNPVLDPSARPSETSPGVNLDPEPLPDDEAVSSSRPWYGRWYVWAGVGAVVAAGTVGAVMATQGSAADPLTPDQVCGPAGCDAVLGAARGGNLSSFRIQGGAVRF